MRVISGTLRGLKLESLPGLDTRPTLDRVKEALFSMLYSLTADSVGLDLFAGSGALGIELLSRYGKECTFVDSSSDAIRIISANVKKCRMESQAHIEHKDALDFLKTTGKKFDIVFIDPPYASGLYTQILQTIKERKLLTDNAYVVCECDSSYNLDYTGFEVIKDKTYGKVRLYVLEEAKHS